MVTPSWRTRLASLRSRWLRLWSGRRSATAQMLTSTEPVSRLFGFDRGQPIDRYYIEAFLLAHANDIRGRVLEVGGSDYTERYGGPKVARSDVLHAVPGSDTATIVADLADAPEIPDGTFDCLILTQTLQFVYDVPAAMRTVHRILRPGGVALVTVPGISQISRYDMDRWGEYWRFTSRSLSRLAEDAGFPRAATTVRTNGNALVASSFLYGLAADELTREQKEQHDPDYEVLLTLRVVKPEA